MVHKDEKFTELHNNINKQEDMSCGNMKVNISACKEHSSAEKLATS